MLKLIKYIIIIFILVFSQLHSKLNWEHEFEYKNFIKVDFLPKIIECNSQYYQFYYGTYPDKIDTVNGIALGRYPALLSLDINGNLLFQKEDAIPLFDSLKINGYQTSLGVTEYYCTDKGPVLIIPEGSSLYMNPNYFKFSSSNGELLAIDGVLNIYQSATYNSIINKEELFVLSNYFSVNNCCINVHSLEVGENNNTLKYRIALNYEPFANLLKTNSRTSNFIFINDSTFFVIYKGEDLKTNILAKYSYNRDSANTLPTNSNINSNLINYITFTSKSNQLLNKLYKLDNGNYLATNTGSGFVMFNENSEIIYNDLPFANSSYDNFNLSYILPLKKKSGYFALYGWYNDNDNRNFAIVIVDSLWNKVDEFVWDYGETMNYLDDIVESDDGNLIVYGRTTYIINSVASVKPYYASVHFDFLTGVEDKNNVNNEIIVQPNPATEYIIINLSSINPTLKRGVEGEVVVEIYDVMGVLVAQTSSSVFNGQTGTSDPPRIDISHLSPGVYFVKIHGSNGASSVVEKFVKM